MSSEGDGDEMNGDLATRSPGTTRAVLALLVVAVACIGLLAGAAHASAAGSISGQVTDATEAAIAEVEVCAVEVDELGEPEWVQCKYTNGDGDYTLPELASGEYAVEFWAPYLGYRPECWDDRACWAEADPVAVADEPVSGIDAALDSLGRIQGSVTDLETGAPVAEGEVCALQEWEGEWEWAACAETDTGGDYELLGLWDGDYLVEFWSPGYELQYYDGKSDWTEADPVSVELAETVTGIDAQMKRQSVLPDVLVPPPPPPPTPPPAVKPKRKKCRKGFRRKKLRNGRYRCVRKQRRRAHRPRRRHR